jgi:hypothetical protein
VSGHEATDNTAPNAGRPANRNNDQLANPAANAASANQHAVNQYD